ncbi:hypothetical protein Vadar_004974 [Vaccinium darrowii]|uniref:Uncharacterized protein n=1 Tax=Vaccinium darrowii TaxID=229202 RepID=A0ACB7Z1S6_9ERIC|nr:hypothetical protein Vadar_004974 [Vaccinium darrowii]
MELCTSRGATSNLSHHTLFTSNNSHLQSKTSLRFKRTSIRRTNPGLLYYTNSSVRSTSSEEASRGSSQYVGEERGVATLEDVQPFGKNSFVENQEPKQDSSMDRQAAALEFLENIDIKLASKYAFSALLVDIVALIALWLAVAVVGAIDSIPVFPKVMEVVGLSYTLWFSTRYLIFKENREELFAKIDGIKQKEELRESYDEAIWTEVSVLGLKIVSGKCPWAEDCRMSGTVPSMDRGGTSCSTLSQKYISDPFSVIGIVMGNLFLCRVLRCLHRHIIKLWLVDSPLLACGRPILRLNCLIFSNPTSLDACATLFIYGAQRFGNEKDFCGEEWLLATIT